MANGEAPSDLPRHLGDFRIRRELGRGGMGVVYEAWQESLGRTVALKVLEAHLTRQPATVERFHREAAAVAGLHHPNVLPVYASGEEDGTHYFAMELVEGVPLDQLLDQVRDGDRVWIDAATVRSFATRPEPEPATQPDAPVTRPADSADDPMLGTLVERFRQHPIERICRLVLQMASALDLAHEQRLLHRDVKTSNILLRPDGTAVLIDFGLARDLERPSLTQTGDLVGSPYALAPEQINERPENLDRRVDVYALGVVLYELLTLRRPFEGKTIQDLLQQIQSKEPLSPRSHCRNVPRDLETICMKALEKDRRQRYASCQELAEDLRRFLSYLPIRARPTGWWRRTRKFVRRQRAASVSAAVLLACLAGAAVYSWTRPAHVMVRTEPSGASVMLDGVWQDGVTPLHLRVTSGEHRLEVHHAEHEGEVRDLDLRPGATEQVSLQLAASTGTVHFITEPAGARVSRTGPGGVDFLGVTPFLASLSAGEYEVELHIEGFRVEQRTIQVPSRGRQLEVQHRWATGQLHLSAAEPGAIVALYRGRQCAGAPVRTVTLPMHDSLALAPGPYAVRCQIEGHDEVRREEDAAIVVEAERTTHVALWNTALHVERRAGLTGSVRQMFAGDPDGDGVRELFVLTEGGELHHFGVEGRVKRTIQLGFEPVAHLWWDREAQGLEELILGCASGTIVSLDHRGHLEDVATLAGSVTSLAVSGGGLETQLFAATDVGELAIVGADRNAFEQRHLGVSVKQLVSHAGEMWAVTADGIRGLLAEGQGPSAAGRIVLVDAEAHGTWLVEDVDRALHRWWPETGRTEPVRAVSGNDVLVRWPRSRALVAGDVDGVVTRITTDDALRIGPRLHGAVRSLTPVDLGGARHGLAVVTERRVHVLHEDGTQRLVTEAPGRVTASLALDSTGSGFEELWLGNQDGEVWRIAVDHRQVLGWQRTGVELQAGDWLPHAGDEVLVQVGPNRLELLGDQGRVLRRIDVPEAVVRWRVVPGDSPWIILGGESTLYRCGVEEGQPQPLLIGTARQLLIADLDEDGTASIVAAMQDARVTAFDADGAVRFDLGLHGKGLIQALETCVVNGEPRIVVATDQGAVVVIDGDGRPRRTRRVADGIAWLKVTSDPVQLVVASPEGSVHLLDASLGIVRSTTAGAAITGLGVLDSQDGLQVLAGTKSGELIAWQQGEQVWSRDLVDAVLNVHALDDDAQGPGRWVVITDQGVVLLDLHGRRCGVWSRSSLRGNSVLADVTGNGNPELVLVQATRMVADALHDDPRRIRRDEFLGALGLGPAVNGATEDRPLIDSGLSWLHLESADLDAVRARLAMQTGDTQRQVLRILEATRPARAAGWARCIDTQVELGEAPIQWSVLVPRVVPVDASDAASAAAILERTANRLASAPSGVPTCLQDKLDELHGQADDS